MFGALKWLVADLSSTFAFLGLYAATRDIFVATAIAMVLGIGQIVYFRVRGLAVGAMQWLGLLLVIVFGSATLVSHDSRFIMLKPTLVYAAIGVIMLKRGWLNRYLTPAALAAEPTTTIFGYAWAGVMFATALVNLAMVQFASPATWAWGLVAFTTGSKLILVAAQFWATRRALGHRTTTRADRQEAPGLLP